jgi:hypothetical protein
MGDTGLETGAALTPLGRSFGQQQVGADVVVDVSNAPVWDDDAVREFFTTSSRHVARDAPARGRAMSEMRHS